MKEYNPETHFLMPIKASTTFKWFRFIVEQLGTLIILLGVALLLCWSLLQVLLMFKALV